MNKQEVKKLIKTIKICYSDWYSSLSASDRVALVELYEEAFVSDDFDLVNRAFLELVDECELAPTMYEIRKKITKIRQNEQIKKELEYARKRPYKPASQLNSSGLKFLKIIKNQIV